MAEEQNDQDAAWVTIETLLSPDVLLALCRDPIRMLRINSMLEFEALEPSPEHGYRMKALNLTNGKQTDTDFTAEVLDDGLVIAYAAGLKSATRFQVSTNDNGHGVLTVTDDYSGTSEDERRERMNEVDQSLVRWGNDLQRYFQHWSKWSWLWPYRWYMERMWQSMKPSARRISYLLIMITLAEFVMFLMVFVVFWLELDSYLGL